MAMNTSLKFELSCTRTLAIMNGVYCLLECVFFCTGEHECKLADVLDVLSECRGFLLLNEPANPSDTNNYVKATHTCRYVWPAFLNYRIGMVVSLRKVRRKVHKTLNLFPSPLPCLAKNCHYRVKKKKVSKGVWCLIWERAPLFLIRITVT